MTQVTYHQRHASGSANRTGQGTTGRIIPRTSLAATGLLAISLLTPSVVAQAGGGAGGGAGAGAAGGSAAGSPGAGGSASRGAATGQTGSNQTGTAASPAAAGTPQSAAAAYAAGASPGPDPRRPAASKPGAYTLQQVIALARTQNPTLLAADSNLRAVRAQEKQAGVRANPYVTLYGTNVTLPAEGASNPYSYSAQVSRLFERGEKRRYRLEAARATTGQTEAQLQDTVRQTILSIKQAFTKMLIAKIALELSNASLKDYRHEVDIANDRYKAGDLGKLDFERLDLQLSSFESDALNNEINLLQASDQLQTLIGIETPTDQFDVTGDIVPPAIAATRAELIQDALANRPDYRAAQQAIRAAEANARLAVSNSFTDPTLEGEYDRSGTYNSAGFSINIPLRLFDRNAGNIDTARFQAEGSRLNATAARNQVVSDVDQAWIGYTRAKTLSDRYTAHYLDESRDVLSIAQFSFEHGGLALIDYLDTLRDARNATSNALNAYSNTWSAIHQLSAASSTELVP